ncbi:psbQ-like protein 3, chloroplastic [Lolium perenne]|nr:psbQ-like protein 3, chloroplastic [Lolium perenne]XP_051218321.1 psbQ-like protein 3, chloroplastic [Lolium perenne]
MLCTPEPMENRRRLHQGGKTRSAMALQLAIQSLHTSLSRYPLNKPTTKPRSTGHQQPQEPAATTSSRRSLATAAVALIVSNLLPPTTGAAGALDLDLRITIPEQSSEEAEANVRTHARNLVRVKEYIDARSWRELQAALRASASNLKQDLYAIIQAKPGSQRPELRRLYSELFNSVTRLDYAARDKDEVQVKECYGNIVAAIDQIFARIM